MLLTPPNQSPGGDAALQLPPLPPIPSPLMHYIRMVEWTLSKTANKSLVFY